MRIEILITIIIPVYNKEKYLETCLNSVYHQTYSKIEVIIINDGSTDGSEEIIKKCLEVDSRITYIKQKNVGVSETRNKGIELARGEYLYFLDADDYLDEEAISRLVEVLKESPADISIANFSYNKNGAIYKNKEYKEDYILSSENDLLQKKAEMFLINGIPMASACNKLYKTNFLKTNRLQFEDGILAEDRLFNLKCYTKGPTISIINTYTYVCNVVNNSRSREVYKERTNESIALFENFYSYLQKENIMYRYIDLLQMTLILDIKKILLSTYKINKGSFSKVKNTINYLKSKNSVKKVMRTLIKNQTLKKVSPYKSTLIYRFISFLFVFTSSRINSIIFIAYRKTMDLKNNIFN